MLSAQSLRRLLAVIPRNELFQSPIQGLVVRHSDFSFSYEGIIQEPSICIVLSGEREVQLGDRRHRFDNRNFMFCPVNVPMHGKIAKASPRKPAVVISMKIDVQMVGKILLEQPALTASITPGCMTFGQWKLDKALEQAFERLLLLHESPNDIPFLAPLIQQEIHYRLLTGPQGSKLKDMASTGSHIQKIACATDYLRLHFRETVTVKTLASLCGMSMSGFHSHFKKITSLSPLQYQKSLRLMEARRLIAQENRSISDSAYQVGYESASQFSREYRRHFGHSPKEMHDSLQQEKSRFMTSHPPDLKSP